MMTSMTGIFARDAVASSFRFMRKQPSPATLTTVLSGIAHLTPRDAPSPYPIVPSPPEVKS